MLVEAPIFFDSNNLEDLIFYMDTFGDSFEPFFGKNESGEDVTVAVFSDKVIFITVELRTRRIIKNVYYRNGVSKETYHKWGTKL